jgi:hypothetical protein
MSRKNEHFLKKKTYEVSKSHIAITWEERKFWKIINQVNLYLKKVLNFESCSKYGNFQNIPQIWRLEYASNFRRQVQEIIDFVNFEYLKMIKIGRLFHQLGARSSVVSWGTSRKVGDSILDEVIGLFNW